MEKRLKRIEVILIVLAILTLINFIINILPEGSSHEEVDLNGQKDLPENMSKPITDELVFTIRDAYNDANWSMMYETFGEWAKLQIELEEISSNFEKLKPVTGAIGTYSFSHHVYNGYNEGAEWYVVFYRCKFKNGKGTIKLTIRSVDVGSEVVGIHINLDEI